VAKGGQEICLPFQGGAEIKMLRKRIPEIRLDYFKKLTDDMGLFQFGKYSVPDRKSGYTTDDNARALIVALKHHAMFNDQESADLAGIYLGFLHYAQKENGRFHNLVDYRRNFLDEEGSEDAHGRALWSCGFALDSKIYGNIKKLAKEIFEKSIIASLDFRSLRARAYAISGLYHYFKCFRSPDIMEKMIHIARLLEECYAKESDKTRDWKWFEPYLTYDNARLSEAFFYLYEVTAEEKYLRIGLQTLEFLTGMVLIDEKLVVIGQEEWYQRDGIKSVYDQQPIDAAAMVDLYVTAYRITKDKRFRKMALISFEWFLGRNVQNASLYDENTSGCYDGLNPKGLNLNQGAEAIVSYLLARLDIEELKRRIK